MHNECQTLKERKDMLHTSLRRQDYQAIFKELRKGYPVFSASIAEENQGPHNCLQKLKAYALLLEKGHYDHIKILEVSDFLKHNTNFIISCKPMKEFNLIEADFCLEIALRHLVEFFSAGSTSMSVLEVISYVTYIFSSAISEALFIDLIKILVKIDYKLEALNSVLVSIFNLLADRKELVNVLSQPEVLDLLIDTLGSLHFSRNGVALGLFLKFMNIVMAVALKQWSDASLIYVPAAKLNRLAEMCFQIFKDRLEECFSMSIVIILINYKQLKNAFGHFTFDVCNRVLENFETYAGRLEHIEMTIKFVDVLLCNEDQIDFVPIIFPFLPKFIERLKGLMLAGNDVSVKSLAVQVVVNMFGGLEGSLFMSALQCESIIDIVMSQFTQADDLDFQMHCLNLFTNFILLIRRNEVKEDYQDDSQAYEKAIIDCLFAKLKNFHSLPEALVLELLRCFEALLDKGEEEALVHSTRANPYVEFIISQEHVFTLELLQQHPEASVGLAAQDIIEKYFDYQSISL